MRDGDISAILSPCFLHAYYILPNIYLPHFYPLNTYNTLRHCSDDAIHLACLIVRLRLTPKLGIGTTCSPTMIKAIFYSKFDPQEGIIAHP